MLFGTLTHPPLLSALARSGHGSKILLSDGNYPHSTGAPASAERIFLNLAPGLLSVDDVLRVLTASVPLEAAEVMLPPDGIEVPAILGYRDQLPDVTFIGHDRFGFYEAAQRPDVAIVVATGDQRVYANLLLTIGVRPPEDATQ